MEVESQGFVEGPSVRRCSSARSLRPLVFKTIFAQIVSQFARNRTCLYLIVGYNIYGTSLEMQGFRKNKKQCFVSL